jgi:hypothetical protein
MKEIMKIIYKIAGGIGLLSILMATSSCLKNGSYYTNFATASASVDFPLAASSANQAVVFAFSPSTNPGLDTLPVYVDMASPSPLGTAVTATISVDAEALDSLNAANGSTYIMPPSNAYSIDNLNLTITAGQRLDSTHIVFNFANFADSVNYVIPLIISSSSLPIEQWNLLFLNITIQ